MLNETPYQMIVNILHYYNNVPFSIEEKHILISKVENLEWILKNK